MRAASRDMLSAFQQACVYLHIGDNALLPP